MASRFDGCPHFFVFVLHWIIWITWTLMSVVWVKPLNLITHSFTDFYLYISNSRTQTNISISLVKLRMDSDRGCFIQMHLIIICDAYFAFQSAKCNQTVSTVVHYIWKIVSICKSSNMLVMPMKQLWWVFDEIFFREIYYPCKWNVVMQNA